MNAFVFVYTALTIECFAAYVRYMVSHECECVCVHLDCNGD